MKSKILKNGPLCLVLAAIFLGAMATMVKLASRELPAAQVALIRFVGGVLMVLAIAKLWKIGLSFKNKRLLLLRGLFSGIAIFFYFKSISLIPTGKAVMLNNTYPIWTAVLSAIFLKEKIRLGTIAALSVSLGGVFLILNPSVRGFGEGDIFGLLSGFFAADAIIALRKLRKTDEPFSIYLVFCAVGALISLPLSLASPMPLPSAATWAALGGIMITSLIGQVLLNQAFGYAKAAEGSIVCMITVIVASTIGHFLFGEIYSMRFIIGVCMVAGSAAYLATREGTKEIVTQDL